MKMIAKIKIGFNNQETKVTTKLGTDYANRNIVSINCLSLLSLSSPNKQLSQFLGKPREILDKFGDGR